MLWMRSQLLVTLTTPLRAPSTRVSLFEFKSTHTEASRVIVGGLVGCFKACVRKRIAADSPQQWPQSDLRSLSPCSKLMLFSLSTVSLLVYQAKATHWVWEREVYACGCACVFEREERKACTCVYYVLTDIYMHARNHSSGRAVVPWHRLHIKSTGLFQI